MSGKFAHAGRAQAAVRYCEPMSPRIRRLGRPLALLSTLMLVLTGCDPNEDDDDDGDDEGSAAGCATEMRDDTYTLGMEKSGAAVTVRFVDAMPAPPDRGDNTWTVEVIDTATGTPLDDVELSVEPFMPDHQHGTSIACHVTAVEAPGQFELAPVNLFMPGLWEVRLHFTLADATTDQVNFNFCVNP